MNIKHKNIDYWKNLIPQFHINDSDTCQDFIEFSDSDLDEIVYRMKEEGYLAIDPVKWNVDLDLLSAGIKTIVDAGHLPVYGFIYDEYWNVFRLLNNLILKILGPYKNRCRLWIWYIDPTQERKGFSIHREYKLIDKIGELPKFLTIWVPLTDATNLNSCMYVVPANRDPYYLNQSVNNFGFAYEDIRALPAEKGSILGWNHSLLHWGSRSSSRTDKPRISISAEFQSVDSQFIDNFNCDLAQEITFDQRLTIIEHSKRLFGSWES